jgi:hypothetical protein
VPERDCSWLREKPNDFVDFRATNRVGKDDRLWQRLERPREAQWPGAQKRRAEGAAEQRMLSNRGNLSWCDDPTRILTMGEAGPGSPAGADCIRPGKAILSVGF